MTYATYWIKQSVMRYIEKFGTVVRMPSVTQQKILCYKKTVERLSQKYGRIPTDKETAVEMCISASELNNLKKYSQSIISLDIPCGEDTKDTIGNSIISELNIENDVINKIYDAYEKSELWGIVERYTSTREYEVVKSRYVNGETLQTIADRENISKQMVRDIEASAIRKLRYGKAKRELQDKLDLIDCGIYRNGISKFNEHNFTSTVEYVALRRAELKEQLRSIEKLHREQRL